MTHRLTYVMAKIHHPCRMNGVAREGQLTCMTELDAPVAEPTSAQSIAVTKSGSSPTMR